MRDLISEFLEHDKTISYFCNICRWTSSNKWKYNCADSCATWTKEVEIKF